MELPVSSTPVNVVDGLSLTLGTRYTLQFDAGPETSVPPDGTTLHLTQAADAPAQGSGTGIKLEHLDDATIRPETGVGIWAWVPTGRARGTLKVEKAAG